MTSDPHQAVLLRQGERRPSSFKPQLPLALTARLPTTHKDSHEISISWTPRRPPRRIAAKTPLRCIKDGDALPPTHVERCGTPLP